MSQPQFVPRIHSTSLIVIPARLASTRLPRKLLLRETGKPLIQHTYEAASRAARPRACAWPPITTRSLAEVQAFGGEVRDDQPRLAPAAPIAWPRWRASCPTPISSSTCRGTSRKSPAKRSIWPSSCWNATRGCMMSTLATPIRTARAIARSGLRESGVRRPGPGACISAAARFRIAREWDDDLLDDESAAFLSSTSGCMPIGAIFCCGWPNCRRRDLEKVEKLEQLRVLAAGHAIAVGVVDEPTVGIDTPAGLPGVCANGS